MMSDEEFDRRLKHGRLLALMLLVLLPAAFLIIASLLNVERFNPDEGSHRFMLYMLLIVAFLEPPVSILVRRFQVSWYRQVRERMKKNPPSKNRRRSDMTPGQFFMNALITRLSFINAVFILGLIAYLLTGELTSMLYFYAIGIVWSVIFWPREEKVKTFIKSLEEI